MEVGIITLDRIIHMKCCFICRGDELEVFSELDSDTDER